MLKGLLALELFYEHSFHVRESRFLPLTILVSMKVIDVGYLNSKVVEIVFNREY